MASTGIAAQLLPRGQTSHTRFKIPIDADIDISCRVKKQSNLAALLWEADAIIWDEVSPQSRHHIEGVSRCLQDVRNSEDDFGGLTVVFGGDWAQTLPVVKDQCLTASNVIEKCLASSPLWPKLTELRLNENMRLSTADKRTHEYISFLKRLVYDPTMHQVAQVPDSINVCPDEDELIQQVYRTADVLDALQNQET